MTVIQTGEDAYASDAIAQSAMGDEFLGWDFLNNYGLREDQIGAYHTRWPGGIPAEDGIDTNGDGVRDPVFSLTNPDLMDWDRASGTPREGFSDVAAEAVKQDNSFSLVVGESPYVKTYLEDGPQAAYDQIRSDVDDFVSKVCAGDFGEMPKDFVVEIGSEYYATDLWKQSIADGADPKDMAYAWGSVSAVMSDAFKDAVAQYGGTENGFDPEIAVQLGRIQSDNNDPTDGSAQDNVTFISAFDDLVSSGEIGPQTIDAVIWHRYDNNFSSLDDYISDPASSGELQSAIDAWSGHSTGDTQLVVGWDSPDIAPISEENAASYGPAVASSTLQAFSMMAAAGMDYGTIFGTDIITSSQYGLAGGKDVYFGGQLYSMMTESLPGTHLLEGVENNTPAVVDGKQVQDNTVNTYAFEDDSKVVVFLAAKDFSGDSLDYNLGVEGAYTSAEITTLQGDSTDPQSVGTMQTSTIDTLSSQDGVTSLDLTFESDMEVIRVTLTKDPGAQQVGTPSDTGGDTGTDTSGTGETIYAQEGQIGVHGGAGDDTLYGANDASLSGWGGNDLMIGQGANDTLYGNAGDDTLLSGTGETNLFGGDGNDLIGMDLSQSSQFASGGDGSDQFDISAVDPDKPTTSRISDFDPSQDTISYKGEPIDFSHLPDGVSIGTVDGVPTLTFDDSARVILGTQGQNSDAFPDQDHSPTHQVTSSGMEDFSSWFHGQTESTQGSTTDMSSNPDGSTSDSTQNDHQDSSHGGSCFVATAAYGGHAHPDVCALRKFRDEVLLPHPAGRAFIRLYWTVGPHLARHVDSRGASGSLLRAALGRLVSWI